eukprot:scaffold81610_cov45-Tisochrysis_lutea.AAC.1
MTTTLFTTFPSSSALWSDSQSSYAASNPQTKSRWRVLSKPPGAEGQRSRTRGTLEPRYSK